MLQYSDFFGRAEALKTLHAAQQAKALRLARFNVPPPPSWDLDRALRTLLKRILRHTGSTSKYQPHQGAKECARRVRQGAPHGR